MTPTRAIELRHAVREYKRTPIDPDALHALQDKIANINFETGMHFQLITNEPKAFGGIRGKAFGFKGVRNYIAVVTPKGEKYEEMAGYYGEQIVLLAQQLGLNTCWVYATAKRIKKTVKVDKGEKYQILIAIGYGKTQGEPHISKEFNDLSATPKESAPVWYKEGVRYAHLAPTAMNQQKFQFELVGPETVKASITGTSICTRIDLGIVKLHFEIGAGKDKFHWAD